MSNLERLQEWLDEIRCDDGFEYAIVRYGDDTFLVGMYDEVDIAKKDNGKTLQKTRKWYISDHATKSEFCKTAFKCYLTSMEHRAREHFKYRGKAVFGPHFDIDALHEMCDQKMFDYRDPVKQDGFEGVKR